MHRQILTGTQLELLPFVKQFSREFYLVGGTAIALHLGHRRSVDFDLFKYTPLNTARIKSKIVSFGKPYNITRRVTEQMNVSILDVKFTFFEFPFDIPANCRFENVIKLPELLDLAAMKAYALGRRSKWKDYVDLYFIIKIHFSIEEISRRANELFGDMFSEKLFRSRLAYHKDINYSEPIEFLGPEISENEIKEFLIEKAIDLEL